MSEGGPFFQALETFLPDFSKVWKPDDPTGILFSKRWKSDDPTGILFPNVESRLLIRHSLGDGGSRHPSNFKKGE